MIETYMSMDIEQSLGKLMKITNYLPELLAVHLGCAVICVILSVIYFYMSGRDKGAATLGGSIRRSLAPDAYTHPSGRIDVMNFLFVCLLWKPLRQILFSLLFAVSMVTLLEGVFGPRAPVHGPAWLIVTLQFLGMFLGFELGFYGAHLASHKLPFLWAFHRGHHSAEARTVFVALRAHPIDAIVIQGGALFVQGIGLGLVCYILGAPMHAGTAVIVMVWGWMMVLMGMLHHCSAPISFGKLNHVFNAPVMHQLHHSIALRHRDRNMGWSLTIFDGLFGTLYVPGKQESFTWGLSASELGEHNPHLTMRGLYIEPIAEFLRVAGKAVPFRAAFLRTARQPAVVHGAPLPVEARDHADPRQG